MKAKFEKIVKKHLNKIFIDYGISIILLGYKIALGFVWGPQKIENGSIVRFLVNECDCTTSGKCGTHKKEREIFGVISGYDNGNYHIIDEYDIQNCVHKSKIIKLPDEEQIAYRIISK